MDEFDVDVIVQQTGVCAKKFVKLAPCLPSDRVKLMAFIEPSSMSWSSVSMKKMLGVVRLVLHGLGGSGGTGAGGGGGAGAGGGDGGLERGAGTSGEAGHGDHGE